MEKDELNENLQEINEKMRKMKKSVDRVGRMRLSIYSIVIIIVALFVLYFLFFRNPSRTAVETIDYSSSIKETLKQARLNTYETTYKGIAVKYKNDDISEKPLYYVSYEASVKYSIEFDEVEVKLDETNKKYIITLPEITMQKPNVDLESIDYIFKDNKAKTGTVSEEAYRLCELDVYEESLLNIDMKESAIKSTKNIITSITKPIIDESHEGYGIEFRGGNE